MTESDWSQGTTNLHLDISDACNLMVYVGIPEDEPPEAQETLIQVTVIRSSALPCEESSRTLFKQV